MLYDKYVNKAKKIVSFKNFLIRFKGIIIAVTASTLTLSTSYVSTKGLVVDKTDCPLVIEYGSEFEYEANALFADVTYEYSLVNENNWVTTMPRHPGEYKVRGVSKRIFGGISYGKEHIFEIQPKAVDVEIIDSQVVYGEIANVKADLVADDVISNVSFEYAKLDTTTPTMKAISDSIIVKDSNGNDISNCYTFNPIEKEINLLKRDITITVHGDQKVYDGTSLICHQYEVTSGNLFNDDQIYATFDASQLEVGSTKNEATVNIINKDGVNITKYYNIAYEVGSLDVTARPLLIYTSSASKVYDGQSLISKDYKIDEANSLVNGHNIEVSTYSSIENVGSKENVLALDIFDSNKESVLDNYAVSYVVGKLEITPRQIKITSESAKKVYDGSELSCLNYTIDNSTPLVDNHEIKVVDNTSIVSAGTTENVLEFEIYNGENNVTSNYKIELTSGSLSIDKKEITISSLSDSKVYDGIALENNNYEIISGEVVEGQVIEANFSGSIVNVGEVANTFTIKVLDENNNDLSSNYEVTTQEGLLKVTKREIDILTSSATKEYDGTKLESLDFEITSETKLAKDQIAEVISNTSIIDVNEISNELTFKILNGEDEVTENYIINVEYGKLKITPKDITLLSLSAEKVYDGKELNCHDYEIIEGSVANNQVLENTYNNSIIDVGTIDNSFETIIKDENNTDVTTNYDITKVNGTLTISKRIIDIQVGSAEKVYDGKALTCLEYEIVSENKLAETDVLNIISNTSLTVVGTVDNVLEFSVFTKDNKDNNHNYEINVSNGELKVKIREIGILTNSNSKIYDDTELVDKGYTITKGSVAENQQLEVIEYTSAIDVNEETIYNELTFKVVEGDVDVTKYYSIEVVAGTLTINPRPVTIQTGSIDKIYDGIPVSNTNVEISDGSILQHHEIVIETYQSFVDANIYDNYIGFTIIDKNTQNNKIHNYDIELLLGKITINPRPITIKTGSAEKIYDGIELTKDEYEMTEGTLAPNQTADITVTGTITDVGEKYNYFDIVIIDASGNQTTHNYDITRDLGILKINPRPITIKTGSAEKIYDGTPLTKDGYEITEGTLAPNQTADITVTGTITDVGEVFNDFDIVIRDISGNQTTHNYVITRDLGILKVNPIKLYYSTGSAEKVYDGTPLTNDEVTFISGELLPTHEITIYAIGTITNVGSVYNDIEYKVIDVNTNENKSANYEVIVEYGILTVTPITLKYKTGSGSKTYDGTPLTNPKVSYISGEVLKGHEVTITAIGTITNAGRISNEADYIVVDSQGNNVTDNYLFDIEYGSLEVKQIELKYATGGASKEYDGTPLTNNEVTHISGNVLKGHTITVAAVGTITNVGKCYNDIEYSVVNENNEDVSLNYDVKCDYGVLRITGIEIVVKTGSDTKLYDGTPLTCSKITYNYESLKNGDTLYFEITGSQTEIGKSYNKVNVIIYDSEGNDVTKLYYDVNIQAGVLTVTDGSTDDSSGDNYGGNMGSGTGGGSVNLDTSGNLAGVGFGGAGEMEMEGGGTPVFYITSDVSGAIYFRLNSFGDYKYSSWNDIPPGYVSLEALTNPNYLTARALQANGYEEHSVTIEYAVDGVTYLLPYYATNAPENLANDYFLNPQHEETYTLNYIPYIYSGSNRYNLIGTEYEELEKDYYEFVKQTYLSLPESTKTSMLQIAAENSLDVNNSTIIEDVANYIQNAATYNLKFAPYPYGVDYAVYFLTDAKEGICQHYATAATAMYRALGIPARYTTGFVGYAEANKKSPVTTMTYHAWVEVYIQGMGWVEVEVTGAGAAGGGAGGGSGGGDSGDGSGDEESGSGEGGSGDETGGEGSGGNPSNLDTSGKLTGAGQKGEGGEPVTMFHITSQTSGSVYLKIMSFGDYSYDGWDATPTFYESLNSKTNPMYLSSKALENDRYTSYEILIEYEDNQLSYLLPYYTIDGPENMPSDYIIDPGRQDSYVLNYIPYTYSSSNHISLKGTEYEALEAEYYEFVKDNYLSLPASTYLKMLEIAGENNLNADSETVIEDVAKYIQNAATYNLEFAPYPDGVDYAVYFLTEAKEGICQHYSTAAVAMYRALGIPARYTVGFVGDAVANTKTPVTSETAHAWVEVYIEGMGWVNVEVTGSGSGAGGSGGEDNEDDPLKKIKDIVVKPIDINKEYDGTPLVAENEVDFECNENLSKLYKYGYTWDVEIVGSQTELGKGYSEVVSFTIYDNKGNDVTDTLNITYKRGELLVTGPQIEIYVMSYQKEYDGTELTYSEDDCIILAPEGITVEYDIQGTITEPGKVDAEITNIIARNEQGEDVTELYYIDIIKGSLSVEKINIEVTANSAEKVYDGSALTNNDCWISFGKLLEGHELVAEVSGKVIDIGSVDNEITSVKIYDKDGNDVTKYYEIKKVKGTLTII